MSVTKNSLELNRKHLAGAFIEYCMRRNQGMPVLNLLVGRRPVAIGALNEHAVCNCLIQIFEKQCIQKYGAGKAESMLTETYSEMLSKDNSRLMPDGVDFINEVMKEAVSAAIKNPTGNNFGLEVYS
ncbi:hypothetical protein MUA04_23940 [Enterobacteriaceae bacterium H11S18]|uniref:hypothetical protein n=1 Tax=Dryocola clanedunensis TaxID=2925396 RepID=UPI0022F13ED2|nr:hypothetical protein [Dryocola clanedunensis]MCT4713226.1 hypothetical protein [Dryocola clanedunensis]